MTTTEEYEARIADLEDRRRTLKRLYANHMVASRQDADEIAELQLEVAGLRAENDRLRAQIDEANHELMRYQVGDPYEVGWEHGCASAMKAVDQARDQVRQWREAAEAAETHVIVLEKELDRLRLFMK